jgi:hypothetical protein
MDRLVAPGRTPFAAPLPHAPVAAPRVRTLPLVPAAPAPVPVVPPPLQPVGSPGRHWQEVAAQRAGLDLAGWHTELGFAANQRYVWGGYEYYRQMQLAHPQMLWAGMAFGIGPTFAAALQDLAVFNRYARHLDRFPALLEPAQQRTLAEAHALAGPATVYRVSSDLERKLLQMQQAIFLDQGMQHEAYLGGGMDAIRQLRATGAIDDHAVSAWQAIDDGTRTGDRAEVETGNLELLRREQMQTIAKQYDEIRELTAISPLVTHLLTTIGRPAIPGSRPAGEVVPVRIGKIPLPIPAIDISRAEDRWRVIQQDTWPAFTRLVDQHPADYGRMLTTSLDQRIADGGFRHLPDSASPIDVLKFLAHAVRQRLPLEGAALS